MNHYDVLGIPKDCEQSLIEHVYKSLVKIYHPDVFKGDKFFAQEKLKAINLAYSELGNPDRRKFYDAELSHGQSTGSADEIYDDEWKEYDAFSEFIAQDWSVATDYFPNVDSFRRKLVKINKNLAFYFQIELIATKRFRNAEEIFLGIRKEYLNSKFGDDLDLHNLVLSAIETGNRRFAIDLNKALVVLGKDEFLVVLYRLIDRYPEFCRHNYIGKKFSPLLRQKKSMGLTPGKYRAGSKSFGVSPDYSVYIEGMHFNGVSFENFDSIESLVNSGRVSEQEVRGANKIF